MKKEVNVGIIGFGTVGTGAARILIRKQKLLSERLGASLKLKRVADLDIRTDRGFRLPKGMLIKDAYKVIDDPDIDVVVELIGGIRPAKDFILAAIKNGKHVVSANKALFAKHGGEIFRAVSRAGVEVGFEACVAGGIPIIKAIREGLSANSIESIYGIVNGTSNYILSEMGRVGAPFDEILKDAQKKGYAEADPTFDVEGIDAAHKLAILVMLTQGASVKFEDIYTEGISRITPLDIDAAREFGCKIKLLAIMKSGHGEVDARVHPTMLPEAHHLATVDGVFNALWIKGDSVGEVMLYGRGAGMMPTGSAIVADILGIARGMVTGSKFPLIHPRGVDEKAVKKVKIKKMDKLTGTYYLRFTVLDKPGVLSKISGILGANDISITNVIQKVREKNKPVPIVLTTHEAGEKSLKKALKQIDSLKISTDKSLFIRMEK